MTPFYILCGALWIIPLCGNVFLDPIIPVFHDLRSVKQLLVVFTIIIISIVSKYFYSPSHSPKLLVNSPLMFLMLYLPISLYQAPPVNSPLWIWQGMFWVLLYYLLYDSIIRLPFVRDIHRYALSYSLTYPAVILSLYVFVQALGMDQWQAIRGTSEIGSPESAGITGTIGNPTYLALWLALCLPFVLNLRKWYFSVLMYGAIYVCHSDTADILAILCPIMMTLIRKNSESKILVRGTIGTVIFVSAIILIFWGDIRPHIQDNARFTMWESVIKEIKEPPIRIPVGEGMSPAQKNEAQMLNQKIYPLTGHGLGSFPYLFSLKYGLKWESAHNEYLEIAYSIGLIGLGLIVWMIGWVLWKALPLTMSDELTMMFYVSFILACLGCFTNSLLHVEPLRFYTAISFSFLCNRISRRGK